MSMHFIHHSLRPGQWWALAALLLAGIASGGCGGCGSGGPPPVVLALHVDPDPVVAGGRAKVSVTVGSPSPESRFRWFASLGAFAPAETLSNSTVYVAPALVPGSTGAVPVRVWVAVVDPSGSSRIAESVIAVVGSGVAVSPTQGSDPSALGEIEITEVPPFDRIGGPVKQARIAGTVRGFNRSEHRILIYSKTDDWWVQPRADEPLLWFGADGKWEADIFLGSEYAVFVVNRTFQPPARTPFLPRIDDEVLKVARAKGRQPIQ